MKRRIKELNQLVEAVTNRPFVIVKTKGNHFKILIDGLKTPLFTGSTISDHRANKNLTRDVRGQFRKENVETHQ